MSWLEELEQINQKAKGGDMFDISVANIANRDSIPRLIAIARAAQTYYDRADSHGSSCLHYDEDAEPGRCDCGYDALREALKEPELRS